MKKRGDFLRTRGVYLLRTIMLLGMAIVLLFALPQSGVSFGEALVLALFLVLVAGINYAFYASDKKIDNSKDKRIEELEEQLRKRDE